MRKLLIFVLISVAVISCKKSSDNQASQVCYDCRDFSGNLLNSVCGSSEDDAYNIAYGSHINGDTINTKQKFIQNCPKRN